MSSLFFCFVYFTLDVYIVEAVLIKRKRKLNLKYFAMQIFWVRAEMRALASRVAKRIQLKAWNLILRKVQKNREFTLNFGKY